MASISWKLLKVGAVVGTLPAIGIYYGSQMRSTQMMESRTEQGRVFKISEIPVYNTSRYADAPPVAEIYPRDRVEAEIGNIRRTVQDVFQSCSETYQMVEDKVNTGIAHTQATVDYLQNDPNEVVRIMTITVAGLGGMVVGFRGSKFRRFVYACIGAGSMASLCYPKASVELTEQTYAGALSLYDQMFTDSPQEEKPNSTETFDNIQQLKDSPSASTAADIVATVESSDAAVIAHAPRAQLMKGDPGQSNPEDKDMYSTRS